MSIANNILQRVDETTGILITYRETEIWHDGSYMNDSKADGYIFRKKENEYYKLTGIVISVEDFGAVGDGKTDDTEAFIKASEYINSLVANPKYSADWQEEITYSRQSITLLAQSSLGYVISDTVEFIKPFHFLNSRILYRGSQNKPAVILNNSYKNNITVDVVGKPIGNFTSEEYRGLVINNAMYSNFYLNGSYFTKAITIKASDGLGCAFNKFFLGAVKLNRNAFVIQTVNGGWANANVVYGGEFSSGGTYIDAGTLNGNKIIHILRENDGTGYCQQWSFYNQYFESGRTLPYEILAFDFSANGGVDNIHFIEMRVEQLNDERIGITTPRSQVYITTKQLMETSRYEDNNGYAFLSEPIEILNTGVLKGDFKLDGDISYVRKLDSFNYNSGIDVSNSHPNIFCQLFELTDLVGINVAVGRNLRYFLMDENMDIIVDNTLLTQQINQSGDFNAFAVDPIGSGTIKVVSSVNSGEFSTRICPIAEAKYIGILQETSDESFIKVSVDKSDISKIKKLKVFPIPEEVFYIKQAPNNLDKSDFKTGETYFSKDNTVFYQIKDSGKSNAVACPVNAVLGEKKLTVVNNSDLNKFYKGTLLKVNANGQLLYVTDIIGSDVFLNVPISVSLTSQDINFPQATW